MEHQQEVESRQWQNHCRHHFAATAEPATPEKLVAAGEVVHVPPAFWLQWHSQPQGTKGMGVCYPIPLARSGVAWKPDNPGHSRDTCTPAPLLPSPYSHSKKSLQLGRSQTWWSACDPCAPSVNASSIKAPKTTEAQWQQRKWQGKCQLSNTNRGSSGRETKICAIAPPTEKPEKGLWFPTCRILRIK